MSSHGGAATDSPGEDAGSNYVDQHTLALANQNNSDTCIVTLVSRDQCCAIYRQSNGN